MLVPGGTLLGKSNELPAWAILQEKASDQSEATFTLDGPHVPFEAESNETITLGGAAASAEPEPRLRRWALLENQSHGAVVP